MNKRKAKKRRKQQEYESQICVETIARLPELAEKAGIARSTIAKMGKNEIVSLDVIVKICDALDCDIVDVVRVLPTENS